MVRHGNPSKLYPCAFFSQKLASAKANYHVENQGLLTTSKWNISKTLKFDFTVTYKPGSRKSKVDALSHCQDPQHQSHTLEPMLPPSVIIMPIHWDLMEEISRAQQTKAPECPPIKWNVPVELYQCMI